MIKIYRTIESEPWSTFDLRALEDDGCVVDVGCLGWDWSNFFIGKKRIVGIDPFEKTIPNGVELFSGVLGTSDCYVSMDKPFNNEISAVVNIEESENNNIKMLSWKTFCREFNIDVVSLLKINIEGSEYSFLESLTKSDFSKIKQIVVSFNDWLHPEYGHYPEYNRLTKSSIKLLEENGFTVISTHIQWGWYLCVKK